MNDKGVLIDNHSLRFQSYNIIVSIDSEVEWNKH
jgi:hypothetical protein